MSPGRTEPHLIGVDIGGTFTDLALLEPATGRLAAGKVLTDHDDLAAGVIDGIAQVLGEQGVEPTAVRGVIHGTTLATNVLIERRGARTALVVTRGFRDLLEMGRESRYDIYDIEIEVPPPLVPRERIFEVTERLDHAGRVVVPLAEDEVEPLVTELRRHEVEAVAVCLLHAFRNPVHERALAMRLAALAPELLLSLSSDVMPDIREYERASTTTANAYVQPALRAYLGQLEDRLEALGVPGRLQVMTSDGGTISGDTALRYPVRVVESGPAGGALAAAFVGSRAGLGDVMAFDMGGTTAKICLVEAGQPRRATQFEVARVYRFAKGSGLPLKIPVLEMIEIGAGGGSIAGISQLGLLQIGPESAGASPGPACYGRGGREPTITDADLCLGYLDADYFLGGRHALDPAAAAAAIESRIAGPLGMSLTRAAWGIHAVVNDNMARAAKIHALEHGRDPRRFTLVAYGGAGPVHGYRLAEILGMSRIVFPMRAGVMSALGFLVAPPAIEFTRARIEPLDGADTAAINTLLEEMEAEGRSVLRSAGVVDADVRARRVAAVRYAGQTYDLPVPVPDGAVSAEHLATVGERFLERYRSLYHRLNPDVALELVAWRMVVEGPRLDVPPEAVPENANPARAYKGSREVYLPEHDSFVPCPVYDRYRLGAGARFAGPAIVEELESTAVIGPEASAEVDPFGNLVVLLPAASGRSGGR